MKWIVRIVIAVVLLAIVALVGVYFYLDTIARSAIEQGVTQAAGVKTSVSRVHLGIFGGEASIGGLRLDNPEGFDTEFFLKLDDAQASVTLGSLLEDTVEIPHIGLSGIEVHIEQKGEKANYKTIVDNLAKLSSGDESEADSSEGGKDYVVRRLDIKDVTVHATLGGKSIPIEIPRIELTDIGTGEGQGVKMDQLSGIILDAIFKALLKHPEALPGVLAEGLQSGVNKIGDIGHGAIEKVGEEVDKAINKTLDGAGQEIEKGLEGIGKGIEKGIGDLLGGKKKPDAPQP